MKPSISENKPVRTLKKILFRIGLIGIAGLVLLLVLVMVGIFSLQTGFVQTLVQSRINSAIPGAVSWSHFRFSLLRGTVSLEDLEIRGPEHDRIAGVTSFELDISLPALRQQTLKVEKLYCIGISADLIADTSHQLNILRAFTDNTANDQKTSDSSTSFSWNIIADEVRIQIEDANWRDMADTVTAGLTQMSFSGQGNWSNRALAVGLAIDSGWFSNSAMSIPLSGLALEGTMVGDSITGFEVNVRSGNTTVDLHGSVCGLFTAPEGTIQGVLRADLNELDTMFNLGNSYSGVVTMDIAAAGSLKNPDGTLSLDFIGSKVAGYPVESIKGSLSLKGMQCALPEIMVKSGNGSVMLSCEADLAGAFPGGFADSSRNLDKLSARVQLAVKNINPTVIDSSFPAGTIDCMAGAVVKGVHPEKMNASLQLSASVSTHVVKGVPVPLRGSVAVDAEIAEGRIAVSTASVRANSLTLDVKGSANLLRRTMNVAMNISAPDLAKVTEPLGVKGFEGTVSSVGTVRGAFENPEAEISLQAQELGVAHVRIGDVALMSHLYTDGTVGIDNLTVHNKDSELDVTGNVALFRKGSFTLQTPPHFELSVPSGTINLNNFIDSLQGMISIAANVSGSPDSLSGRVTLTADSIITGVQDIESVSLEASFLGDSITVDTLVVQLDRENVLTAKGFYTLDKRFGVQVNARDMVLQRIGAVKNAGAIEGKVSLVVSGNGSVPQPVVTGTTMFSEMTFEGKRLQDFTLNVAMKNDTVSLNGTGFARIEALLDIAHGDYSADLHFDSTDISPVLLLAGQKEMTGLLDGTISARGNIRRSDHIAAQTDLSVLDVRYRGLNLVSGRNIQIGYEAGVVAIPGVSLSVLDSGIITITGSGSLASAVMLGIDAEIPLGVTVPFVQELPDLAGTLRLKGALNGTLEKPVYQLSAVVKNASVTIPGLEQPLHSLNAKIVVDTGTLRLSTLEGKIGEGSIRADGLAEHSRFKPLNLQARMQCNNLSVEVPETMELHLDGGVTLTGDSSAASVAGEIVILDGLYYRPVNIAGLITPGEKRRKITSVYDTTRGGMLETTLLDIAVKSRSTFSIDNNLAAMEIKPDIKIKGTLAKPVLGGRGTVESGVIRWQKRDLVITRGLVDFLNPYETQATLDIASEITIRDWNIQLGITGTAPDGLKMSLSEKNANPPLPDADIISILATGRTTAEIFGGEGGKTKEQLLASLVASEVSRRLQDGTLLDKVEIEAGNDDDPNGSGDIKVTVGKNISRRLTTLYSFETGSEGIVQRGSAEYKLLERLLLSGFQDTEGTYGGALEWNVQWR